MPAVWCVRACVHIHMLWDANFILGFVVGRQFLGWLMMFGLVGFRWVSTSSST